jgi:hypothetical protein
MAKNKEGASMTRSIALTDENFEDVMQSFAEAVDEPIFYKVPTKSESVWMICVRRNRGARLDD